jgi:transcriptional regulator with XRE-family HTH domain
VSHDTNIVKKEIWESLNAKEARDAFVAAHLSDTIGSQIFSLRENRGWSQEQLASEVGMAQPRISVLEGGTDCSLRTLKRVASAFDVAVVVRFVPFSELVDWVGDLSEERLAPVAFANDNLSVDDDIDRDGSAAYEPAEAAESSLALYSGAEALPSTGSSATSAAVAWAVRLNAFDVILTDGRVLELTQKSDVVANSTIQNRLLGLSDTIGTASAINNATTAIGMSMDLPSLYVAKTSRAMAEVFHA